MPLVREHSASLPAPHPALTPRWIIESLAEHLTSRRRRRIERVIASRLASVTVLLERPYDPHNGAAVLRSSEAFGLLHVHIVPFTEGDFSYSRRITQNADKWLNVYLHPTIVDAVGFLKSAGFRCWAAKPPPMTVDADIDAAELYDPFAPDLSARSPTALVLGNERDGLSDEAVELCDARFHLPMYGFSESLNLSVSAALALQKVTERRRKVLRRSGDLLPAAREQLRAAYYARAVDHASLLLMRRLGF